MRVLSLCLALIVCACTLTAAGCTKNAQETAAPAPPKPGSVTVEEEAEVTATDSTKQARTLPQPGPAIDDSIFRERIRAAKLGKFDQLPIGERIAQVGKLFLGTPYVGGTLDEDVAKETLVVNLRGLDCVTFYENAFAIARILGLKEAPTMFDYREELRKMRYRDGALNGYASRLHYTVDYFRDAERKGLVKLVTKEVGGDKTAVDRRAINFMSQHRGLYKQLTSDSVYREIIERERALNAAGGFDYIPKDKIASIEQKIKTGDLIGVTTSLEGLDCSHTGIAVRTEDGVLHFMHASSAKKEVIISAGSLSEYLAANAKQTGVIIARPLTPKVPALQH